MTQIPLYCILGISNVSQAEYALVTLREKDMVPIMHWRNEQMDILRQNKPLTEEAQRVYYREVIRPTFDATEPELMLFSFLEHGACIGYGGLVHINWEARRAEVSFLVDPKRTHDSENYRYEFGIFLALIRRVAFAHLKLNRLFTETYDVRPDHLRALEDAGFVLEGRLRQHALVRGAFVDSLIHGFLAHEYDKK